MIGWEVVLKYSFSPIIVETEFNTNKYKGLPLKVKYEEEYNMLNIEDLSVDNLNIRLQKDEYHEIEKQINSFIDEVQQIGCVQRVDLFGSVIKKHESPNDIDLVVVISGSCSNCPVYFDCMSPDYLEDEFLPAINENCRLELNKLLEICRQDDNYLPFDIKITGEDQYNPENNHYPEVVDTINRHGYSLFVYCGDDFFINNKNLYTRGRANELLQDS